MFDISITDNTKTKLTKYCLDSVEKRIISKCDALKEYISNIKVKITKNEKNDFSVKMIVVIKGRKDCLVSTATNEDLFEAIDTVRHRAYAQIDKIKGKYISKRSRTDIVEDLPISEEINTENIEDEIVKIKTRDVKPMLLKEALTQMKMLEHDFFIYLDAETNVVNVLYKRKNGSYGLIETTISND